MNSSEVTATEGRVSQAVVEAVADPEGVETVALSTPLEGTIDTDAPDRLFAFTSEDETEGDIVFTYSGCEVTVPGVGSVSVEKRDE